MQFGPTSLAKLPPKNKLNQVLQGEEEFKPQVFHGENANGPKVP